MKQMLIVCFFSLLGAQAAQAQCTNKWGVKLVHTTASPGNSVNAETITGYTSTGANGGWTVTSIHYGNYTTINFDGGNNFGGDPVFPGGINERLSLRAEVICKVPVGTYTLGLGSDDGGLIRITPIDPATTINFFNEVNENGDTGGNNVIRFNGGRGHAWTTGSFTVNDVTILKLTVIMFEGGGGESVEIAMRKGQHSNAVNATDWRLIADGVEGWELCQEGFQALRPATLGKAETEKDEPPEVAVAKKD